MELEHRFTVPASVDETWAMFNDLEKVAPCFPGAALTSVDGDDFAGTVKVKLGPVSLQYSGTGTFVERDEDTHTARFEAKGKDKRGNGTAAAKVRAVLEPDGAGTAVAVSTDLAVTGKPAQFGRGLMQDVSDKLLDRFVDCLTEKLTAEPEVEPAQPPPAQPPPEAEPPPAQPPPATARTEAPASQVALDLGSTLLPVLAKRYGPPALGLLVIVWALRRLLRR
jgi:carbon monoxide dehydrogenase subunit G